VVPHRELAEPKGIFLFGGQEVPTNEIRVAVLIDGGYFLDRYRTLYKAKKGFDPKDPQKVANDLYELVTAHSKGKYLYRVLYYDARPLAMKVQNPISKKELDFSTSIVATFRNEFFEKLKAKRNVALRLGYLLSDGQWLLRPTITRELLSK
jgi:hypothetical protein